VSAINEEKNREARAISSPETIWNDTGMKTLCPVYCKVIGNYGELALLFGNDAITSDDDEVTVNISDRMIFPPLAAKRFAVLLDRCLKEYESKYGPLSEVPLQRPDLSWMDRKSPKAELLLDLTNNLSANAGFERSFKILNGKILANRFLLGFEKSSLGKDPGGKVLSIGKELGMPESFREPFLDNLAAANDVLFGFEENEKTCIYKVYLEFWDKIKTHVRTGKNKLDPRLMYLGFKWDAADSSRCAIANYTCFPMISVGNILERISDIFSGQPNKTAFDIAAGLVKLASERGGKNNIKYIEVEEDGNPRKSFDLNMYKADIPMREIEPFLFKMCSHYEIPIEKFHSLYDPVANSIFGHLSGGVDREGRDFFTVYFDVE